MICSKIGIIPFFGIRRIFYARWYGISVVIRRPISRDRWFFFFWWSAGSAEIVIIITITASRFTLFLYQFSNTDTWFSSSTSSSARRGAAQIDDKCSSGAMSYSISNDKLICSISTYRTSVGKWVSIDGGGDSGTIISEGNRYSRIIRNSSSYSGKGRSDIVYSVNCSCRLHKGSGISAGISCSSGERSGSPPKIKRRGSVVIDSRTIWFDTGSYNFNIDRSAGIHSRDIRWGIGYIIRWR